MACETLLWIGPRDAAEFCAAYAYCELAAAQIAYRPTIADAKRRPASGVDRVLIARTNRAPFDWKCVSSILGERCQTVRTACLLGNLCEGVPHAERFSISELNRLRAKSRSSGDTKLQIIKSHAWNQFLPQWLGQQCASSTVTTPAKQTVAVIAATFASAQPLIDLVAAAGHGVLWLREPQSIRVRGIDRVIWDDSFAVQTTLKEWQSRIALMSGSSHASHVWITNGPQIDQVDSARRAGVRLVLSKPFQCDALSQWLEQSGEESFQQPNGAMSPTKVAA